MIRIKKSKTDDDDEILCDNDQISGNGIFSPNEKTENPSTRRDSNHRHSISGTPAVIVLSDEDPTYNESTTDDPDDITKQPNDQPHSRAPPSTTHNEPPNEQVLSKLWQCSPVWQLLMFNYISFLFMMTACWPMIVPNFIAAPMNYSCYLPPNNETVLPSILYLGNGSNDTQPVIERNPLSIFEFLDDSTCEVSERMNNTNKNMTIRTVCPQGYQFYPSPDFVKTSIVSEWSLVCDKKYMAQNSHTVFMVGVFVGGAFLPTIADYWGRKKINIICQLLGVLFGILMASAQTYNQFVAWKFFAGVVREGVLVTGIVWCLEFIPARFRPACGIGFEIYWTLHWFILTLLAYLIRDWRWLQTSISLPPLLAVSLIWWVPESPTWLLAKHKYSKLKAVLSKHADRINKTPFPLDIIDNIHRSESTAALPSLSQDIHSASTPTSTKSAAESVLSFIRSKQYTLLHIFKSKRLCAWTAAMSFLWFQNVIGYYGLTFLATFQAGDKYTNFLLNGLAEVPAYLIGIIVLNNVGRRWPLFIHEMLAGTALLASVMMSQRHYSWEVLLTLLSKYALTFCFGAIVVYAPELYPTTMRTAGLGTTSAIGRLAGLIVPYTGAVYKIYPHLPAIGFGVLGFAAGLVGWAVLPETRGLPLPESMADIEKWPYTQISCRRCCRRRRGSLDNEAILKTKKSTTVNHHTTEENGHIGPGDITLEAASDSYA